MLTEFKLTFTYNNEIYLIIKSLEFNCACGIIKVYSKIVERYCCLLTPQITSFLNNCIKDKYFPKVFKLEKIIPIFKSGNKTDPSNYRPITILNVFTKVLNNRLNHHFRKNITPKQYGILQQSSTTSVCVEFTHALSIAIDKNVCCVCFSGPS